MCGILGFVKKDNSSIDDIGVREVLKTLYSFSENRGHDSSGIAVLRKGEIDVNKMPLPASKYIKTKTYEKLLENPGEILGVIAHARMETNGSYLENANNQPIIKDGLVTVHNGIIVNDSDLWEEVLHSKSKYDIDTEVFNSLVRFFINKNQDLPTSLQNTLKLLKGSYSFATFFEDFNYLFLATNTGSLFYILDKDSFIFASEYKFLLDLVKKEKSLGGKKVVQLKPGGAFLLNLCTMENSSLNRGLNREEGAILRKINVVEDVEKFKKQGMKNDLKSKQRIFEIQKYVEKIYEQRAKKIKALKRCTKCILPETMPFIDFDEKGVCNYCNNYSKIELKGEDELNNLLEPYRRNDGKPECIMAFSGGRDSSYALHYVKKKLGLNPVAYSYDWGMITDLGRRNQARMTGELGVEHVLISADIKRKRENIKRNVEAWLKRPNLGTVPLFMAGDKQYFYYASMLSKQMDLDLVILSENLLEVTNFKTGFCGVRPKLLRGKKFYSLNLSSLFKLLFFYGKEYALNPSYINRSLSDSIGAFTSYYVMPHNLLSFYNYISWEENEVEKVLLNEYDWEVAADTRTTWRIGDGTASFYNYIYYILAGFSEIDTFRSNQIREGHLSREQALSKSIQENKPRVESLVWYTDTIGVDLLEALKKINNLVPIYDR